PFRLSIRFQVKSCRPHLIPACCIDLSRASRSGESGLKAVLMPNGESASKAIGAAGDGRLTVKLLCAVGSSAATNLEPAIQTTTNPAQIEVILMRSAAECRQHSETARVHRHAGRI